MSFLRHVYIYIYCCFKGREHTHHPSPLRPQVKWKNRRGKIQLGSEGRSDGKRKRSRRSTVTRKLQLRSSVKKKRRRTRRLTRKNLSPRRGRQRLQRQIPRNPRNPKRTEIQRFSVIMYDHVTSYQVRGQWLGCRRMEKSKRRRNAKVKRSQMKKSLRSCNHNHLLWVPHDSAPPSFQENGDASAQEEEAMAAFHFRLSFLEAAVKWFSQKGGRTSQKLRSRRKDNMNLPTIKSCHAKFGFQRQAKPEDSPNGEHGEHGEHEFGLVHKMTPEDGDFRRCLGLKSLVLVARNKPGWSRTQKRNWGVKLPTSCSAVEASPKSSCTETKMRLMEGLLASIGDSALVKLAELTVQISVNQPVNQLVADFWWGALADEREKT